MVREWLTGLPGFEDGVFGPTFEDFGMVLAAPQSETEEVEMNFWFPLSILLTITAFYLGLSAFIFLHLVSNGFLKRGLRARKSTTSAAPAAIAATLLD